jgi:metallophosphoesterase (TIGR00282 family)
MTSEEFWRQLSTAMLLPREQSVRILFVGDVIGRPGRKIVKQLLPELRRVAGIDFVLLNGENLAGGFGITEKTYVETMNAGVDAMTMGNHWNDKPDIHKLRTSDARIVFPHNLTELPQAANIPEFDIPGCNRRLVVLNFLGQFAMKTSYGNPFEFLKSKRQELQEKMASGHYIIVGDVHAEASSEKQAILWYLNGLAAAIVGTHTHTPTSDERITASGSAFLSDIGMTGAYNSIIGMSIEKTLKRYFPPTQKGPHEVADHNPWFTGFLVEINKSDNLAVSAHRLQYRERDAHWVISSVNRDAI